jgi:hypothetical protein
MPAPMLFTELDAYGVLDGTVQRLDERVRVDARALDGETRVQLWSGRYEGNHSDLFGFQEAAARRIAEALRIEICSRYYGAGQPAEAMEHYFAARRLLRTRSTRSFDDAVASFSRCLEIAPRFAPAIAGHAVSMLRRSWGIEWLDLCPILTPLRRHSAFLVARRQVRARVDALMNT